LHNVFGLWCAPLLLLVTLTAVLMSEHWANDLVLRLTGASTEHQEGRGGPTRRGGPPDGRRDFDGQPALMLRVANLRHHAMAEAEFRVMFVRNELVKEGEVMRRFHPLQLQFDHLITFPVALTIRHIIDVDSPLYGLTAADLEKCDARVLASIVCIDTVIPAPVQSQRDYTWKDIRFGHRFVEIYTDLDDHRMAVDYGRLHDTEKVPVPSS
jgi:hypothetical protein